MRFTTICALLALALLTQCAPGREPDAGATQSSTPAATAIPTIATAKPAASAAVSQTPSAAPSLSATSTPAPTPGALSTAKPTPDPNAPAILAMNLDKTDVHGGDTVSGTIVTSLSVASVEARIAGFGITVPKVAPGKFALSYTVPDLPIFLRHAYPMAIIARNTAGASVQRSITINVR